MIPKRTGGVGHGYTGPGFQSRNHTFVCRKCSYQRRAELDATPRCINSHGPMKLRQDRPKPPKGKTR